MAFTEINQRFADEQRHRENRARLAFASHRCQTEGYGTVEFDECIDFGLTFIERPFIAIGHQIDVDRARDQLDIGPDGDIYLPQVTGYVTDWDMTDRDHYVGCWVAVTVTLGFTSAETTPEYPMVKVLHDFTWSGVALKDLPDSQR